MPSDGGPVQPSSVPYPPPGVQPASAYAPYVAPAAPVQSPDLRLLTTVLMLLAGVVGLVGACLPYFVLNDTSGYSVGPISFTGWMTPYSGIAAIWMIGAAGVALLDSGWVPTPKGSDASPYRKYVLMGSFGGAMVLAFASSQLWPSFPDSMDDGMALHLGVGFWLEILAAVVGFVAAVMTYLNWMREQNPRPAPAAWPGTPPPVPRPAPSWPAAPQPAPGWPPALPTGQMPSTTL